LARSAGEPSGRAHVLERLGRREPLLGTLMQSNRLVVAVAALILARSDLLRDKRKIVVRDPLDLL
jgi:hypothetical protein